METAFQQQQQHSSWNSSFYLTKQALNIQYARNKLQALPTLGSDHDDVDDNIRPTNMALSMYVVEWLPLYECLYGVGLKNESNSLSCSSSSSQRLYKMKLNVKPALFVWVKNEYDLKLLLNHKFVTKEIHRITSTGTGQQDKYFVTSDNVITDLCANIRNPRNLQAAEWSMYRVCTKTFFDATSLYFQIKENRAMHNYLKIPGKWSIEIFLACEYKARSGVWPSKSLYGECYTCQLAWCSPLLMMTDDDDDDVVYKSFTERGGGEEEEEEDQEDEEQQFPPNLLTFDIETVSPDPNRVPTGERKSDIIFSVSLTKICAKSNKKATQYTLMHIPHKDIKGRAHNLDGDDDGGGGGNVDDNLRKVYQCDRISNRVVKYFFTEIDLLLEVCRLFSSFEHDWFVLLGYNSRSYDMTVLYNRLVFYHLVEEASKFFLHNGILTYGAYMTHIDIFLLFKKFYSNETGLKSLKLEDVSQYCFQSATKQKVDFSAVTLRKIYAQILEADKNGAPLPTQYPQYNASLEKIALYNDVDSVLVLRLWQHFNSGNFFVDLTKSCNIAFGRLAQAEINECISCKLFITALQLTNTLFCHTSNQCMAVASETFSVSWDNTKLTSSARLTGASKNNTERYTGGFNYRSGKDFFERVEMCDFVAYYPFLIEGFNISHETASIVTVQFLASILDSSDDDDNNNRADNGEFFIKSCFDIYRFTSHKNEIGVPGLAKPELESAMNSKAFLNGCMDNASKLVSLSELKNLADHDRLVIINKRQPGALSILLANKNQLRKCAKSTEKRIQTEMSTVRSLIRQVERISRRGAKGDGARGGGGGGVGTRGRKRKFGDREKEETQRKAAGKLLSKERLLDELRQTVNSSGGGGNSNRPSFSSCSSFSYSNDDNEFQLVTYFAYLSPATLAQLDASQLRWYLKRLSSAQIRIYAMYRYLKILNSSFYGLLGSSFPGVLASLSTAAIVTCLARKFAIDGARYAQSLGYVVALMDTDSMFLATPSAAAGGSEQKEKTRMTMGSAGALMENSTPAYLQKINRMLVLETKEYQHLFVMAKKVYFALVALSGQLVTKGITKNGPPVWTEILHNMYRDFFIDPKRNNHNNRTGLSNDDVATTLNNLPLPLPHHHHQCSTMSDIPNFLEHYIFEKLYSMIDGDDGFGVVLCNQRVMSLDSYKTDTPAARLMRSVLAKSPEHVFSKTINYFHLFTRAVQVSELGLAEQLTDEKNEKTYTVKDLNLYKFLNDIRKPIYNVLSFHLTERLRNKGVCFVFSLKQYEQMMQNAFLNAREKYTT